MPANALEFRPASAGLEGKMDLLAETGAGWFCTGAHMLGNAGFEMTTCGSPSSRFVVGLFTVAAVAILCLLTVWRVGASRRLA